MAAKKTAKKPTASQATKGTPRAAKPKMGRPPKGPESRTDRLGIRLSPTERAELDEIAARYGMPLTDLLLAAARAYRG